VATETILVVEDDPSMLKFVASTLRHRGYEVQTARDGVEALEIVGAWAGSPAPGLVILDLGLPRMDGFEVLELLRRWSRVPVLVLSAHGQEEEKVRALDLGADDYLTKPFGVPELLARVRAALRRASGPPAEPAGPFVSGGFAMDFARRRVAVDGREVRLTPKEYALLEELVLNAGKVLTHQFLLGRVWGHEYLGEYNYLRVFVRRLRRKIEADPTEPRYLLTEPGVGYRFAAPAPPA
jgi:two-component system KDP operon response regulator KdpE